MKRIIAAAIAAISCNVALADPASYVSASIGSAEQKLSDSGLTFSDSDTAFQIAAGYRYTPNFGAEVGYTHFGTGTISVSGASVSAKPQSVYLAATGAWNATPEFALTGKLGIARTSTKVESRDAGFFESETEKKTSLVYGVGVSYAITPMVAAIADYQNFGKIVDRDGGTLKAHVVSAGVRVSF